MSQFTINPAEQLPLRTQRRSWLDQAYRAGVLRRLRSLQQGRLTLTDGDGAQQFGDLQSSCPGVDVTVHDHSFYRKIASGGALGAGGSYIDGDWSTSDLTSLLRFMIRNESALAQIDAGKSRLALPFRKMWHALRRNSRAGSKRNIAAHYDLGNEFYRTFLDETMTYSAGIFEHPQASLAEASRSKLDRVCRKLGLQPDMHLLEIGTGWGSFAQHAAERYGCRVTTTTISEEQFRLATQRIADAGLQDRVTVLKKDYRDLTGKYDRLVAIEMIEAVGHHYLPTFLRQCDRLLRANGQALLQAITMAERYYENALRDVDFIKRYVFPGSFIPSLGAIHSTLAQHSSLQPVHCEDFGPHYARTLQLWRDNFHDAIEEVRALGFNREFERLWDYYLCYCEAGFLERTIGVSQLVLNKPQCRSLPQVDNAIPALPDMRVIT